MARIRDGRRAPLTERSRCGIHGDSTSSGRCASCDADRANGERVKVLLGLTQNEMTQRFTVDQLDCELEVVCVEFANVVHDLVARAVVVESLMRQGVPRRMVAQQTTAARVLAERAEALQACSSAITDLLDELRSDRPQWKRAAR